MPLRDVGNPSSGLLLGERYRLGAPLGAGAMGVVFSATDERMGREVAVKVVRGAHLRDPEALARFEREAHHTGRLGHPNIVAVTDLGRTDDGFPYVVMERLEGRTLEARIDEGPLPVVEAVQVHVQLLDALACAHDAGVLHRDVKPANLFLSRLATGAALVKLLDFGIATASTDPKLTLDGALIGSPTYLAPERFLGQPARIESDLYAVGVSLYESLAADLPFGDEVGAVLVERVLYHPPPRLDQVRRDVPAALAEVVVRALAKSPEARFASARQMREALCAVDLSALPQTLDAKRPAGTLLGLADPSSPIRSAPPESGPRSTLPQGVMDPSGSPATPPRAAAPTPPGALTSTAPLAGPASASPPAAKPPSASAPGRRAYPATEVLAPGRGGRLPELPPPRSPMSPRMWALIGVLVVAGFIGLGALVAILQGSSERREAVVPAPPETAAPPAASPSGPSAPPEPPDPSPMTRTSDGDEASPPSAAPLPLGIEPPASSSAPPSAPPRGRRTESPAPAEPVPAPSTPPPSAEPPPPPPPPPPARGSVGSDGLVEPAW